MKKTLKKDYNGNVPFEIFSEWESKWYRGINEDIYKKTNVSRSIITNALSRGQVKSYDFYLALEDFFSNI